MAPQNGEFDPPAISYSLQSNFR